MDTLKDMTWERWCQLAPAEQDRLRDLSCLHSTLKNYEGWRVEVEYYGERKRFVVGRTSGWQPATLGLHNRTSISSSALLYDDNCTLIKALYKVR